MNNRFSELFIRRPVATILLTVGVIFAGLLGYSRLPVSPLPQVDFPVISVQANMPGASPDTMASSVAAPLERHLGQIADVNEMTSQSSLGTTHITLQFGLDRNIDGAARDVQAAINAARVDLPASLRQNPSYHKVNPADAPIMVIAMSSTTHTAGQLYDLASNILQQRLSQLPGIGEVDISGAALPAVRVEINPGAVFHYGIGLEDIRAALASANANSPKGAIEDDDFHYQVYANDQASHAAQYRDLVIAYRNGAPVRLRDVAEVVDSVEDLRNAGLVNGKPGVAVILFRQPGANIIQAVDGVKAELPRLIASLPGDIDLTVAIDRSKTIRQTLQDTEETLAIAVTLVILVVFAFLRSVRAAAIPSVAVPTSIIGSFGVMYLLGFSLNNLSLMALTISTGFVVDDAIVVLENISRYLEQGMGRVEAAIRGAGEVGFTVVSITLSLIAVFAPLLFFGGIVGRLFTEFALTLTVAVLISMVVSLTTTPMMCSLILPREREIRHGRLYRASERVFDAMLAFYRSTLRVALRHPGLVALSLFATIGLNYAVFRYHITYGLFPVQDTGLIIGGIQGDQSISFQAMKTKFEQLQTIVQDDPAVESVVGFTGGRATNSGFIYVSLKPYDKRKLTADEVVARLRPELAEVAGAHLFMFAVSDLRTGGRQSNSTYQYTLLSDDPKALYDWAPKLTEALMGNSVIKDVNSDQQMGGLQTNVDINRDTAMQLGVTLSAIDNTLYDAFGQRQVSTIYNALNQYHVVMEVAPRYWQDPRMLDEIYVSKSGANPTGVQQTGFAAGSYKSATGTQSTAATIAAEFGAQPRHQFARCQRPRVGFDGRRGHHLARDHGSALGLRQILAWPYPAQDQPSGPVRGDHDFVQPRSRPLAQRSQDRDRRGDRADRHALDRSRRLRRHRGDLSAVAIEHAAAVRRGAGDDLSRARHPLREPDPSAHHPLDPVLGQRGRGAGLVGVRNPVHRHRRDRRSPADRHREEERDSDGRFCASSGARGARHPRGDRGGLPPALPPDHDDHLRRPVRRAAAGVRNRRRLGIAPSARDHHRRRADRQPGADALHDAGRLSLSRQFRQMAEGPVAPLLPARRPRPARGRKVGRHFMAGDFRAHRLDGTRFPP